jgi:hypothetical protein
MRARCARARERTASNGSALADGVLALVSIGFPFRPFLSHVAFSPSLLARPARRPPLHAPHRPALQNGIAIDRLSLCTEVLAARSPLEVADEPADGAYVDGLFLEGCRWDRHRRQLAESHPKELHSRLPVLWLRPSLEPTPSEGVHDTPVYRTSARHGKLSTTGHSSNFVLTAHLPTDRPAKH